jgi:hypothetical protein
LAVNSIAGRLTRSGSLYFVNTFNNFAYSLFPKISQPFPEGGTFAQAFADMK